MTLADVTDLLLSTEWHTAFLQPLSNQQLTAGDRPRLRCISHSEMRLSEMDALDPCATSVAAARCQTTGVASWLTHSERVLFTRA